MGATNLKRSEVLYEQHCARVHGTDGNGMGLDMPYMIIASVNFKSAHLKTKTDEDPLIPITQGELFSPMHGWCDRWSAQEMADISE